MKLASYEIMEALEKDDLLAAANLVLAHFGVPELAVLPGLTIYSKGDAYIILLMAGEDCYEWSSDRGFLFTRWGLPSSEQWRYEVIHKVVIWK
jgi:hypothetical protein